MGSARVRRSAHGPTRPRRGRRRRPIGALLVAVVLALAAAVATSAAATAAAPLALTSAQKQERYLDVMEAFLPHAESYWRASDLAEPRTGRYDAVGSGVTQPRGAGNVAFMAATLLTARPDQQSFGGVDRATVVDHTIQSIRHEALTNKLSGAGYDRWGGGTWQASLETYNWAFAAHLLWDRLDEETRALVRRVVTGEADLLLTKRIASGEYGDTGAEDNGWNAPIPTLAAVMFPDAARAPQWRETARRLALNASSTSADATSDELVDGRPLREWMASVNLHPDLTMENHGFFNPIYQQVTFVEIGHGAVHLAQAGEPLPEAFGFRAEQVWRDVFGPLTDDDGDVLLPAGQDWSAKDYQHLNYLTILATRFKRADASVLESRALTTVARRQSLHADGSILGQPQLGYESMLLGRIASSWWHHELFGPAPVPTAAEYEAARAQTGGVHEWPYVSMVQSRGRDAVATMSWDDARPMGLFVPALGDHGEDPVFAAYPARNLIGSATGTVGPYSCDCGSDRFSTAGTIGERGFSMTSFPDGMTMLLDRGSGSAFNLGLTRIDGLTGERPVHSEGGTGLGDLPGDWLNVADRLGMAVAGGGGLNAAASGETLTVTGSKATGSGNRGAALYPLVDAQRTARLADGLRQPAVPDGWSALLAPATDGTARLAVARWAGPAQAELALSDERGAPVTTEPATLEGDTATLTTSLGAPGSRGDLLRFFVRAGAPLRGWLDGERRAVLRNEGDGAVTATVTAVDGDGRQHVVRRVVAAGEQVTARLVDGELRLSGGEEELLRAARAELDAIAEAVPGWLSTHDVGPLDALRLTLQTRLATGQLDRAIAAVRDARPRTQQAAAAVAVARAALTGLEAGLRGEARERVAAARSAATALLRRVQEEHLTVVVRLDAAGDALPGEPLRLRATLLNRGLGAASGGRLEVVAPAGWEAAPAQAPVAPLAPGATRTVDVTVTPPADAEPGRAATLTATFSFRQGADSVSHGASATVETRPLLELTTGAPRLPLAAGGFNEATVTLVNHAPRPLEVTLEHDGPAAVTVEAPAAVTVPALGTVTVAHRLGNDGVTSGSGTLRLLARAGAVGAAGAVELLFGDDLARNGVGAPWPAAFADSNQGAYPPSLLNDGDRSTFWVAAGSRAGDGPSATRPVHAGVDFGAPVQVGSVTMTPRTNYGPRAYTVEVSVDGDSWQQVASVPAAANGVATTSTFPPVVARKLRLRITGGWDATQPPRNVQVSDLAVRAR